MPRGSGYAPTQSENTVERRSDPKEGNCPAAWNRPVSVWTVAREQEKLKLGKRAAFVKSRFKRLRQEDGTWEADFRAMPKPITQSETHYLGLVVAERDGFLLAESHVEGRPSVNDLATLLAHAMRRPLTGSAHRPRRIHLRGHHQWRELFPHLAELGIEVAVQKELPRSRKPTKPTCDGCERPTESA